MCIPVNETSLSRRLIDSVPNCADQSFYGQCRKHTVDPCYPSLCTFGEAIPCLSGRGRLFIRRQPHWDGDIHVRQSDFPHFLHLIEIEIGWFKTPLPSSTVIGPYTCCLRFWYVTTPAGPSMRRRGGDDMIADESQMFIGCIWTALSSNLTSILASRVIQGLGEAAPKRFIPPVPCVARASRLLC